MAIIVSLSSRHKEKCPKSADLGHFFGCVGRTLNSFSRSDTAKAKLLSHAFFLCLAPILCNIRGFCAIPSPRIFGYFADSPHSEIKKPRHEARLFYLVAGEGLEPTTSGLWGGILQHFHETDIIYQHKWIKSRYCHNSMKNTVLIWPDYMQAGWGIIGVIY